MTFYSAVSGEFANSIVSDAFAEVGRDTDTRVSVDETDLIAVMLFTAIGLLLTAAFFTGGFGAEIGQILAVSG
jgi:hypothetical protein